MYVFVVTVHIQNVCGVCNVCYVCTHVCIAYRLDRHIH